MSESHVFFLWGTMWTASSRYKRAAAWTVTSCLSLPDRRSWDDSRPAVKASALLQSVLRQPSPAAARPRGGCPPAQTEVRPALVPCLHFEDPSLPRWVPTYVKPRRACRVSHHKPHINAAGTNLPRYRGTYHCSALSRNRSYTPPRELSFI